ncbi:MAG: hypothetical protein JXA24_03925 [Proteobacteria bacterium]|nr:hypothetical protein [Pseudomonadota bacterium]
MVRAVDTEAVAKTRELKGFEPVRPAEKGRPEVAFESDSRPEAPSAVPAGNALFAARGSMYANMSPAQRAAFMSALDGCKGDVVSIYGEKAYNAVESLLKEVMEFTGKAPA